MERSDKILLSLGAITGAISIATTQVVFLTKKENNQDLDYLSKKQYLEKLNEVNLYLLNDLSDLKYYLIKNKLNFKKEQIVKSINDGSKKEQYNEATELLNIALNETKNEKQIFDDNTQNLKEAKTEYRKNLDKAELILDRLKSYKKETKINEVIKNAYDQAILILEYSIRKTKEDVRNITNENELEVYKKSLENIKEKQKEALTKRKIIIANEILKEKEAVLKGPIKTFDNYIKDKTLDKSRISDVIFEKFGFIKII